MENDAVVGYKMDAGVNMDAGDMGQFGMQITEALDKANNLTATVTLDAGIYMSMEFTMTGTYTTTDKAPETTVPEGANVIDLAELLAGSVEEMPADPVPETAA